MIRLADSQLCTGCGACAFKCPQNCITMQENKIGVILPIIDEFSCINCHACEKICPILNEQLPYTPKKAFAAWSNNSEERKTSASGGIAAEAYKYAIKHNYKVVGASQNSDFTVTHKMANTLDDIIPFKNSKYVFSDAYNVLPKIKQALKEKQKVLFIGLPCQIAAMRHLFKDDENMLLIDIVCHGSTPYSYLKQHINMQAQKAGKIVKHMSFRDPNAQTHTYTFTLYDENNNCFYAKRTKDGDTYQFGYHRAISYRESCYHCKFTTPQRQGDITLADYSGLGTSSPWTLSTQNVSLILENTDKGRDFLQQMVNEKLLTIYQRPLEEPFKNNAQLRHPIIKTKYRLEFEKDIKASNGNFEIAIKAPLKHYNRDMQLNFISSLPLKITKKIIKFVSKK